MDNSIINDDCFHLLDDIEDVELPSRFTFPFYYQPHPLSLKAVDDLQQYLENKPRWSHNFGLDPDAEGLVIGKMFGVLVVEDTEGRLGYLAAFSGKLGGVNHHKGFVPPVFDLLDVASFYKKEEAEVNLINAKLEILLSDTDYLKCKEGTEQLNKDISQSKEDGRKYLNTTKKERKKRREIGRIDLDKVEFESLCEELKYESLKGQYLYREQCRTWDVELLKANEKLAGYTDEIDVLKESRRSKSNKLQNRLFNQYTFLNAKGKWKNLYDIFIGTVLKRPPAGAGECAAPKLLQYAYRNKLTPISMAEFWWGAPLKDEIRKHKQIYPACRGKCEPILGHMLEGLKVDDNPMLVNPAEGKTLTTVYEDEHILVVNKPSEFLSVPGKVIKDSVQTRILERFPDATGPLLVHRLDMSTSGLLIIAKSKEVHKEIQAQFINRTVKKRYVALLDGDVEGEEGMIDLPLRLDINDRPRQMACYDHGKPSKTWWKVVGREEGKTRVLFYPVTGRTHQLRVHAAHPLGLNVPIVGDDLYGNISSRLHLHAEYLKLIHPVTKRKIYFQVDAEF